MDLLPPMKGTPRGSEVIDALNTPKNNQRLVDLLAEAGKHPELRNMDAWYALDPLHQRLSEMHGADAGDALFGRLNTLMGISSSGSEVGTEVPRGFAANALAQSGRIDDWLKWGGLDRDTARELPAVPTDLLGTEGHPYHSTAQAPAMKRYMDTGDASMTKPKVPLYIGASSVPSLGFQSDTMVPDRHMLRGIGMVNARSGASPDTSAKIGDARAIAPWFREKVAEPLGIEPTSAQARMWTTLAPRTGVLSQLGEPKLESISKYLWGRAQELGEDPHDFRDKAISGQGFFRGGSVDEQPVTTPDIDDGRFEAPNSTFDTPESSAAAFNPPGQVYAHGGPYREPGFHNLPNSMPQSGPMHYGSDGFAGGGSVDDELASYAQMFFGRGGSVDDEALAYHTMFMDHGGPVEGNGFFRGGGY
jgi:hypothetical protein